MEEGPCARGRARLGRPRRTDVHPDRRLAVARRLVRIGLERRRVFGRRVFRGRRLLGRRRSLGNLVMPISKEDHAAIAAAIRSAEQRTSGQLVCVLMRSASEYYYVPVLWAALLGMVSPWPMIVFTQWSVQRIFLIQIMVFVMTVLVLS